LVGHYLDDAPRVLACYIRHPVVSHRLTTEQAGYNLASLDHIAEADMYVCDFSGLGYEDTVHATLGDENATAAHLGRNAAEEAPYYSGSEKCTECD
jgi:hypothetical protein